MLKNGRELTANSQGFKTINGMENKMIARTVIGAAAAVATIALLVATAPASAATKKPTPKPTVTVTAKPVADPNAFNLALIGDMPYDTAGQQQTPNVVSAINAASVDFSLFDGDTMSGKGDMCTDAAYTRVTSQFFDTFNKPIFYSVGDNEWTDCDRAVKGAFDPLDRLALVRKTYFQNADGSYITLGKGTLAGVTITHDAKYPELQMFTYKKITFILPHVPGSANNAPVTSDKYKTYNDTAKDGDATEYAARDAANVAWINKGFEKAMADGSNGVIVTLQADMDWEGFASGASTGNNEYTQAFDATKQALLTNTLKFKKPVLLQNGDQHWYQVDMPMNETAGKLVQKDKGNLVEYFTRVQTFGSGFNHWVELGIDPKNPNLWTFTPHIIAANLAAH